MLRAEGPVSGLPFHRGVAVELVQQDVRYRRDHRVRILEETAILEINILYKVYSLMEAANNTFFLLMAVPLRS